MHDFSRSPRCLLAWNRVLAVALLLASAVVGVAHAAGQPAAAAGNRWMHAYATYGEPKYPRGFTQFDYVNPDAPKGGTLHLSNPDRRTSFDKYNPFTVKGNSPAGVDIFMFETLAVMSGDELSTMYGLLAEEMQVAPDKSSITFRLNPKARFTNGDPVTATDVKQSFDMLTSKYAEPLRRSRLAGTRNAVVLDERTIRFDLKDRSDDAIFNLGTRLSVFSRKWGLAPDGKQKPLDQIITEYPITSGPYTIAVSDSGRRLEFARNPDYWGRDLGVRRGEFNFDRIVYLYYQDRAVTMEAFKAGEFDLVQEYSARQWTRQHTGPKWRDGRIVKALFANGFGTGLQSYLFNLRRPCIELHIRLRCRQCVPPIQALVQHVRELRIRGQGPAGTGGIGAARTVPGAIAGRGLRPGLGTTAHGQRPEGDAGEPQEGARVAGRGRLEGRGRRCTAQRPWRALRVRVSRGHRRDQSGLGRLAAQSGKARDQDEDARGGLRSDDQTDGSV
jgi:hypothetical protein